VGAFSPRYPAMIPAILTAAERLQSPAIVQVAQVELQWFDMTLERFAEQFWSDLETLRPKSPVALHLDHTADFALIKRAIALGFTSVMIDASTLPFTENAAITREVTEYAHARGVAVEAELGRIGSADTREAETTDEEMYTDPEEARRFVEETHIDALAVSVGTAHGVYRTRGPKIDMDRLARIRAQVAIPLVIHGGSGVPAEMLLAAIALPGGGISKVNIATELELAAAAALKLETRLSDAAMSALPPQRLEQARAAVQEVVKGKISGFLNSAGRAGMPLA